MCVCGRLGLMSVGIQGERSAKRVKAINKKLRQIEALKKRQADGEELDDAMLKKVGMEAELLAELATLQ